MTDFKDHFSNHSAAYGQYRPLYPRALFQYLASLSPGRKTAWDSATGTGQAALGLTGFFDRVIATDASKNQIDQAIRHPAIEYRVAASEKTDITSQSIDLVVVAQALHWFDLRAFYLECQRVLKDQGVIAVWSYGLHTISPEIDPIIKSLYEEVVGSYWPPERTLVKEGYRDIHLPFRPIDAPSFCMQMHWSLPRLMGYLGTWSAAQRYQATKGEDPVELISKELTEAWGEPQQLKTIEWPMTLKVGINA
jgi:ubiquinone/menaquinone biosynthesis C-methylase UbiE